MPSEQGRRSYTHPALTEFATIAQAFVNTVANVDELSCERQLEALHCQLPQLYATAVRLPNDSALFDDDDDDSPTRAQAAPIVSPAALARLAEHLGKRRYYREVFDPYGEDDEVTGDIVDDLDDIYSELERGLVCWHSGDAGEALWQWRMGFESHWAEHVTSALRALFALSAWHDVHWPATLPSRSA